MAEVISFPMSRRRGLIRRQAAILSSARSTAAQNMLRRLLEIQYASLIRRGIDPAKAGSEVEALRDAIVIECQRLRASPLGAA